MCYLPLTTQLKPNLLSPAGGVFPSVDVAAARARARSRDAAPPRAHRCSSVSDRRAHLISVGLNASKDGDGRRDQPVCVRRAASACGERCWWGVSPRAAGLKELRSSSLDTFTSTLAPSPSFIYGDRDPGGRSPACIQVFSSPTFLRSWALTRCGSPGSSCCWGRFLRPPNSSRRRSRGDSHRRESWISVTCLREFTRHWPTTNRDR